MKTETGFSFLSEGGYAGELIQNQPWQGHSLGQIEKWPPLLKSSLATALSSPLPTAIVWGDEMTFMFNETFLAETGCKPEMVGAPLAALWPDKQNAIMPMVQQAYSGKAAVLKGFRTNNNLTSSDTGDFDLYCAPLRDHDGTVHGAQLTMTSATTTGEAKITEESAADLQHRLKNIFATINSIISQTLRDQRPLADLKPLLMQRLSALSNAHAFAADTSKPLSVRNVVTAALGPHAGGRRNIVLEGPNLVLHEKQAISLFLGMHELLANAVKHGALSQEEGKVAIDWEQPSPKSLEFTWRESGGPSVSQPDRKGFGTTFLERVLPHDFGGRGQITYSPAGMTYRLFTDQFSPLP